MSKKAKRDEDKKDKRGKGDRPKGKRSGSHSDKADPNHDVVFPTNAVNVITVTISPESWQAMQDDINTAFGNKRLDDPDYSPLWVPATIEFDGQTWDHVGVRYKGHWSLTKTWTSGAPNLPLKLDFDKFEDDYPKTKNQRFFGFGELSLANNTEDPAGMRDTLASAILAKAGLPAARTAAYEVFLDHGDGPINLGLYTAIEALDDTGAAGFFGNNKGNLYEAEGKAASLAEGSVDQIPTSFFNQTNEDAGHDDLVKLYTVLHDACRTTSPEAWRAELESVFNVEGFLACLGITTAITHVDTYGFAPHNFYLYNDPKSGKLHWISWDHNQTFQSQIAEAMKYERATVGAGWPLIRFLLDDPVYAARYRALLEENSRTALEPRALTDEVLRRAAFLAPYATKHMTAAEYDAAVADLVGFIETRATSLQAFLDQK